MLIVLPFFVVFGSLWLLLMVAIIRSNIRRWRRGQRDFSTGFSSGTTPMSSAESFFDPGSCAPGGDMGGSAGGDCGPGAGGGGGL